MQMQLQQQQAQAAVQQQQQQQQQQAPAGRADLNNLSYSRQYDELFKQQPLPIRQVVPKPSRAAQAAEPGGKPVLLSDVVATPKVPLFRNRAFNKQDKSYIGWMLFVHGLALLAPFTFSWANLGLFCVMYFITGCLGITLSYHRMLSHKSFTAPKWLEYTLAYCGVLSVEGDPIEWCVASVWARARVLLACRRCM
jgi:stearoyl-CoA desaturase (delta-9 desaturase)